MSVQIYVPCDSAAIALGADGVAQMIQDHADKLGFDMTLVRNGSRGMFWLEPMVEVQTPAGRVAFGPVEPQDVVSLFEAGCLSDQAQHSQHALSLGLTEDIDFLKRQERLTFKRVGITDPLSLADYQALDGFKGLQRAASMLSADIVKEVLDAGLRGRGGAAFPTGIKWKTVRDAQGEQKYIVCNADEGDSGTFSDRMVMECDPYMLIEGMTIAGLAVGATEGQIYVRSEYPYAIKTLETAIERAQHASFLGANILGGPHTFNLSVRKAAGSYVCGEETALLESLEGKRGIVRAKPPLPALKGLFGCPTVVNNVVTLASVPIILAQGADFYKNYGAGRSRGTLPFQLAGNIKHGGLVEKAFGLTLREMVNDFGGGTASGKAIKAIQVGGPLGTYIAESQWDIPLDYEAYLAIGGTLGHGGIVVHDTSANMSTLAKYAMEFCALESCGKCTPCRIGSTRGVEVIDKITRNQNREEHVVLLKDLCNTMMFGSLCAMGGMTPNPVLSALNHYPEDFGLPQTEQATA
jgi:formate dehydrogenase iron-sulfur subunit